MLFNMTFTVLLKTMKKRDEIQSSFVSKDMPLFIHPYGIKNSSFLHSGNLFPFGLIMMSFSTAIWKSRHTFEHEFHFHYSIWVVNILAAPVCHDSNHFYCLVVLHLYLNMPIFLDTGKSSIEMLFVLSVHALNLHICA